jgi:bacteriocin biosynthesis cyclodehydratase domain-containing protein
VRLLLAGTVHPMFRDSLAEVFGSHPRRRRRTPPPEPALSVAFGVGIFDGINDPRRCRFEMAMHCEGVPAVVIAVTATHVLIGPVSIPGRQGCAHCAHDRIRAAAANDEPPAQPARLSRSERQLVLKELVATIRSGPASPLVDRVVSIDRQDRSKSVHRVVPVSFCKVCGGAAASAANTGKLTAPNASADPFSGWVDPITGVISSVHVDRHSAQGGGPVVVATSPPHVVTCQGKLRRLPVGWGKGLTVESALISAVGEAIERYAASLPDPRKIVWARVRDLDGDLLDPRVFPLYTSCQYSRKGFPYRPFDAKFRHPWVRGTWLGGGDVWVPAVLAFLSLGIRAEHLICQGTSNGLAASTNLEDAAMKAIFELVERDAFLTTWMTAAACTEIEQDSLDGDVSGVLRAIEKLGAIIKVVTLSTSVCGTTIACIARGDGERFPGATLGLGADLDPRLALRQAVLELGQTAPHLCHLMRGGAVRIPSRPADVRRMFDHAAFYFPAVRATAFDRLCVTAARLSLHTPMNVPARTLGACEAVLRSKGIRIALVDVTSPDVQTGPFRVVRAISADLQPLSYGYGLERQPVARLREMGSGKEVPLHPIW